MAGAGGGRLPAGIRDDVPTPADLAAVHAVRDHTEAAVRALPAGGAPPRPPCGGRPRPSAARVHARAGLGRRRRHGFPPAASARWARVWPLSCAEAAAALLAGPAAGKAGECEADDCAMLFLPTHPRRRWCSPSRCGNRARVARYYQRHKSAGTAGE